jgi:hypothetical protein
LYFVDNASHVELRYFTKTKGLQSLNCKPLFLLVRPERFERPTPWFVAKYSIQLSYGRMGSIILHTAYFSKELINILYIANGGERGIRTLDTDLSPYASLAGKCLRPLGQLSVLLLF